MSEFRFIDTDRGLADAAAGLRAATEIGVDAEMSGMHAYRTQVCLLQVATDELELVIDTLAVRDYEPIAGILADPTVRTYLHGAVHDVRCLKADLSLELAGLFDTYIAAQLLDLPRLGLSSLVADRFGVELDKDLQTFDWRRRPLTPELMEYLRADIRYLLPLGRQLAGELEAQELTEEAELEFARVEAVSPQPGEPDPTDWQRVKGCRDLSPEGQAVLRELWRLRDEVARERDLPPGRVLRDPMLLEVVAAHPASGQELRRLKGFPRRLADRDGGRFLEALRRGAEAGAPPAGVVWTPPPAPPVAERKARRAREDALRQWRKAEAKRRGVPPMAVLPTYAIQDLARRPPETDEDLARRDGIGAKRARLYAEAIRSACDVRS